MKSYIGKPITIKAGTIVTRLGQRSKRTVDTTVTVRNQETARGGKVRVYWKSHGYTAYANVII